MIIADAEDKASLAEMAAQTKVGLAGRGRKPVGGYWREGAR